MMLPYPTPDQVRRYDLFKLVVALLLFVAIIVLLLRGCSTTSQTETAANATATPQTTQQANTPESATPGAETPPTLNLPILSTGGVLVLSGSAAAGSRVELWANDQRLGEAIAGADGTWSFTGPLAPGDYQLTARRVDPAGKVLAASPGMPVIIPTPAPTPTARATPPPTATPPPATPTALPIIAPTLDVPSAPSSGTAVALSGSGTPGATIEVLGNGKVLGRVKVAENGQWTLTAPLEPGDYTLSARAVDASGKVLAESKSVAFSQPRPAPVKPAVISPTAETPITSGPAKLSGTGSPGTTVELLDNGQVVGTAIVQEDGTWSFDRDLAAGDHALAVQNAGDAASLSAVVRVTARAAETTPVAGGAQEVDCATNPPHGEDRGDTYVVAACEYMGLIASRTGVSLAALIAANPQVADPDRIYPGQVLKLPPRP